MDKTVAGLLGGATALVLIGGAGTASAESVNALQPARTFAELLDPIPNAAERLRAEEQRGASVELAQYYGGYHHHHHWRYHHHHHHHWGYYHHHHHHHHHHHWGW